MPTLPPCSANISSVIPMTMAIRPERALSKITRDVGRAKGCTARIGSAISRIRQATATLTRISEAA